MDLPVTLPFKRFSFYLFSFFFSLTSETVSESVYGVEKVEKVEREGRGRRENRDGGGCRGKYEIHLFCLWIIFFLYCICVLL